MEEHDDRDRRYPCPRDPRQPRQSDRRGRGDLGERRRSAARRCRRGPRPARTRRSRSATAGRALAAGACAQAVEAVNGEIFDALSGFDAEDQLGIDRALIELDGTPNKSRLGANAILGVSLACAKAAAAEADHAALPLCRRRLRPHPAGADDEHRQWRGARRQPDRHPGIHDHAGRRGSSCTEAIRIGAEIFHALRKKLRDAGHNTNVGDEGGFAPNLASADAALGFVMQAIEAAGYRPGDDVVLALDPAATEFYRDGAYHLDRRGQDARCRRARRLLGRSRPAATRSCRSRTAWPRTIGKAGLS